MTEEELYKILENHKHWLNQDCEGWKNMKADLSDAYLCDADLRCADLSYAVLCGAVLRGADLRGAKLFYSDLRGADLKDVKLFNADLSGADLSYAVLYGADLRGAVIPFIPYACPDEGSFIGYKKASNKIVKLKIPEDAKRLSATGRKCRCNKAKVLGIYDYDHNLLKDKKVASDRDKNFIYRVGKILEVKDFDQDRWNECSSGIHFFINFEEAVRY